MIVIVRIEKVREALARAEQLGAVDIEQACAAAAQALGIQVEAVREVAYQPASQQTASGAA